MTRLILIRHGHVDGIQPARFRGRADLALTRLGIRQAEATRNYIAVSGWQPAAVYASPLRRCTKTAEIIAQPFELDVGQLPELIDIDCGQWQGLGIEAVHTRWPTAFALWQNLPHQMTLPGGESLQDVSARASRTLHSTLNAHASRTMVLVTHDSVYRILLLHALDLPLSRFWTIAQSPCCINVLDFEDGRFHVQSINETMHLKETFNDS